MSKHKELGHRLLTPKYFKDLDAFINLANQCGRFKDVPVDSIGIISDDLLCPQGFSRRFYEKITAHTEFLHSTSVKLSIC